MNRITELLKNKTYQIYRANIKQLEKDRCFCLHGVEHGLDVARISYILNLEEQLGYDKEMLYAMALLHDIGRVQEYESGVSHHVAGAEIAKEILQESGFTEAEITQICDAISGHKSAENGEKSLKSLLYRADKLSRNCFDCEAYEECYWTKEMKNDSITI